MADVPWALYDAVTAGPFKTLSALWRFLPAPQLHAARDRGERPWVYPCNRTLAAKTGRCLSSVEHDIGALRDAGWITRDVHGEVAGWRLTDPEGVDAPQDPAVDGEATAEDCGAPQKTAAAEGCGVDVPAPAGAPAAPTRLRAALRLLPAEDCGDTQGAAAAVDAATPRRRSLRGTAENCGPADLLALLDGLTRRMCLPREVRGFPRTRDNERMAAALLDDVAVDGLDDDAAWAARREHFERVVATAERFADFIVRTPHKRRFWGPLMLRMVPTGGRDTSGWRAVEIDVAADLAVEAAREREAAVAAAEKARAAERQAAAAAEEAKRPTAAALDAGLAEFLERQERRHGAG